MMKRHQPIMECQCLREITVLARQLKRRTEPRSNIRGYRDAAVAAMCHIAQSCSIFASQKIEVFAAGHALE